MNMNYFILFIIFFLIVLLSFKEVHPLIMGVTMLVETLLVILLMSMYNKNSLYSMIIYLIMIGGMLILFLYFNMFAINIKMMFKYFYLNNFIIKLLFMFLIYIYLILIYDNMNLIMFIDDQILEMKKINLFTNNKNFIFLYTKFNLFIIFLLLYLLYVLILIVKILFYYNPKSMRQMF